MSIRNFINVTKFLSLISIFSSVAYGGGFLPVLKVESVFPLTLSVLDRGVSYGLSMPSNFMTDIEGVYNDVHIEDLTSDGVGEVVFSLAGDGVNTCSRVLRYNSDGRSLSELFFNRSGICNFKTRNKYIVSSYKDGAAWVEDFYVAKGNRMDIKASDRCVGCGEISRTEYRSDGSSIRYLVSDDIDFEKRAPLVTDVVSFKAKIFTAPGVTQSTKKYLMRGDRVTLLGFDSVRGEDWVEFRFLGRGATTEGWLKCSDIVGCSGF